MALDQVFSSTILDVIVPTASLGPPDEASPDQWLASSREALVERQQAFFDEQLQSFLFIRFKSPELAGPNDGTAPPPLLLDVLTHLQIALEATYISPLPSTPETPRTSKLLTPRTSTFGKPTGRLNPHPSILPPSTPNPVPSTADQDRKYNSSEGTMLVASIWGTNTSEESQESFYLLWSEKEKNWVAIYRLVLTVSFLRLNFDDPLLCLTVSATLREKPIPITPKHPLSKFLEKVGGARLLPAIAPEDGQSPSAGEEEETLLDGLEEVNLLEGLFAGPKFADMGSSELNLPTSRLGTVSRQKLFSLPPVPVQTPVQPSPSPMTAVRKAHPTVRKSYRKILRTASGFRVRMRTVFVPYVLLPETEGIVDEMDEEDKERARKEAGSEEKTVVLCVEIENAGDLGSTAGFMVEKVDVVIGGEGAKATLIGWGEDCFSANAAKSTFPLRIGALAQCNLLYAVTFMKSPEEMDAFSFARKSDSGSLPDLQRAVTINIFGKPYFPTEASRKFLTANPEDVLFPARTFSSRWNCVLDLTAQQGIPSDFLDSGDPSANYPNVMPEPASPFPMFGIHNAPLPGTPPIGSPSTPLYSATAGSKKIPSLPGGVAARPGKPIQPSKARQSDIPREPSPLASGSRGSTYNSPSLSAAAYYLRSPTTYSAPPPPPLSLIASLPPPPVQSSDYDDSQPGSTMASASNFEAPMTPAYPAFPSKSGLPPTPMSQGPIASSSQGNIGPSVEVKRERGTPAEPPAGISQLPTTPMPHVSGAFGEQKMLHKLHQSSISGENIIVSVGLLARSEHPRHDSTKDISLGPDRIYPLDIFTLDIFVFNQSLWPRRFEVTCPDRRRRRRGGAETGVYADGGSEAARKMGFPGVLPLASRVRIGPLRPSACQSVRMDFLAVFPGVHSIDTLTLTDIETGFSMNLRSVLDVVVHDPYA
ncbi:TRAPP trafficking subunit Trs65-domain-containing protein [Panaeolus papilionaceus]|nr:TRAPP trafficking subunit Trs65-domain-containing protein [Panaeolus papilionaceus]